MREPLEINLVSKPRVIVPWVAVAMLVAACESDSSSDPNDLTLLTRVLETNADIAAAAYSDSIDTLETDLKPALETLTQTPSQANLEAARTAWLKAREPYGFTEVYRFRESPIDDSNYKEEGGDDVEVLINAWPLGEALIDYVTEGDDFTCDPTTGGELCVTDDSTGVMDEKPPNSIINSNVPIDADLLASSTSAADERDVISGYHAIEFLLWGQDLNEDGSGNTPRDPTPGQRPATDFDPAEGCTSGTGIGSNADLCRRRGTYLTVAVDKLLEDLKMVRDAWLPGAAYYEEFTNPADLDGGKQRLLEILTGMGTLSEGELAGERMQIALSANSQEDEHSCFSDNTHRDIVQNAEGIYGAYLGDYPGYDGDLDGEVDVTTRAVNGYGIDDYLRDLGFTDLETDASAAFLTTRTGYTQIDADARGGTPIDNVIQAGATSEKAKPMRDTIVALNAQAQQLVRIAAALEIEGDVIQVDASDCDTSDPTSEC